MEGQRRGAIARALGVGARPVARDHVDTGVLAQPCGQRVRLAARQQRHRAALFEVHQHGPVGIALAQPLRWSSIGFADGTFLASFAQSSTPSTDGVTTGGTGACRITFSSVLRQATSPNLRPRRTPAEPPSAKPIAVNCSVSRVVLRPSGVIPPASQAKPLTPSPRVLRRRAGVR